MHVQYTKLKVHKIQSERVHQGLSLNSGHYHAFVYENKQWYHMKVRF